MKFIIQLLLPFAIDILKGYIYSSESKKDDKILDITKLGVDYLSKKTNNTIDDDLAKKLNDKEMIVCQKAK